MLWTAAISLLTAYAGSTLVSPAAVGNALSPRWSADGTRLAWELNAHACKRVQIIVLDERSQRYATIQVQETGGVLAVPLNPRHAHDPCAGASSGAASGFSTAPAHDSAQALDWLPTGSAQAFGTFAFAGGAGAGDLDLHAFQATGGSRLARTRGADSDPRWVPGTGRRLVFTSARTGSGDLYLLDVDSGDEQRLTVSADAAEVYAAPSPDGERVAYVSHDATGDHLWRLDQLLPGATPVRLTDWAGLQVRPSWSPDGGSLAFYANHEDRQRFDLYVMPSGGGTPRLLSRGVRLNPHGPTWTPDGQSIVVVRDDDTLYDPIVRVEVATGAVNTVMTGTVGNGDLDVGTGIDGEPWLAVSAQGRENGEVRDYRRIYTMRLPR